MKLTSVLSWIVILLIAVSLPAWRAIKENSSTTQPADTGDPIDLQYTLAAKYLYGASRLSPQSKAQLMPQLDEAAKTPLQKTAAAVMAGEVEGREAAIARLTQIDSPDALALRAWYETQTPLPAETADRLDWFARVAQTIGQPDNAPARASIIESGTVALIALLCLFGTILLAGLAGLGLLTTGIVLLSLGKLRFRMTAPRAPSHVYVESFAIYLSTFLAGSVIISRYFPDTGMVVHVMPLVVGIVLAVAWPAIRGVRFATQRADWGIHAGQNAFAEAMYGVLGYMAGLPIVGVALLVTVFLSRLTGANVSHPIGNEIAAQPMLMFFIAAVFAPITEELLFRGAFVSHLRGGVGVVLSAVISGLIFDAIHPQGWAAIPVLMAVGAVFALIRQWRDSLIPSIVAHALNNGVLVGFMILLTRS